MAKSPLDAEVNTSVVRFDQPVVLACRRDLADIRPVRLTYHAAGYGAGQVLVRNSSTTLFDKYSAASGSYDAVCILMDPIDGVLDQPATGGAMAKAIFGGRVFTTKLLDYDSGAKADLDAKDQIDARNISITKF